MDPGGKTPGGEALAQRARFSNLMMGAGLADPTRIDLGPLEAFARSARADWVRMTSLMNLAVFGERLKRAGESRRFALAAWGACPTALVRSFGK